MMLFRLLLWIDRALLRHRWHWYCDATWGVELAVEMQLCQSD